jgi:nucleoside-diphosphate-sugar epimerase
MHRILLTGHKGFIGTHLLNRLLETKDRVVVGIDLQDGLDLCDVEFSEEFDLIIHLAGKSGV